MSANHIWTISLMAVFALLPSYLASQSLGPYVIASSGHLLEDDDVMLYGSMGEPITTASASDDIMISQGLLQSLLPEELVADCSRNEGKIFFDNCDDGELYFFIEAEDGSVFDPYYALGIDFDHTEGQTVAFDFVKANFATPCSLADDAISITCVEDVLSTSTDDIYDSLDEMLIYPNPATGDVLHVTFPKGRAYTQLEVLDVLGRIIRSTTVQKDGEEELSVDGLEKGPYFVRLSGATQAIIKKVMIK